jgi:hypothetical protein
VAAFVDALSEIVKHHEIRDDGEIGDRQTAIDQESLRPETFEILKRLGGGSIQRGVDRALVSRLLAECSGRRPGCERRDE